jgi:uncharacterized protein
MSEGPRYSGFVPGPFAIDAYGDGGFRFAGMSHRGSILALPSGVYAWSANEPAQIDEDSLALLFAEPPGAVDLLLIGSGVSLTPISKSLRLALRGANLRVDVMATAAAISTYNILQGEKRRVAAALLATP